ncbi:uncharacterized protein TNCV_584921 [Trichonephila clavipes]|nr:uncharacterized protein TNCV_584921 [Trichonephila clavipes]
MHCDVIDFSSNFLKHPYCHKVSKNEANLAISPIFQLVSIEIPLQRSQRGGSQSEENSLAQSSQDLRVDSGNVDETEVSSGILPEKAQEHIEDSQRNITSCRNEVGTLGTKDEEVTAEMDKGSIVADSFRSEQVCCAELALAWKYAKEGKGNYYEVDGYLFHRDKILGESIGQLVIPKCRRT